MILICKKLLYFLLRFTSILCKNNKYDNFGEDIVILGNGPSLKKSKYKKIKADFCCVNDYPIENKLFFEIKGKYLCLADPLYFCKDNKIERVERLLSVLMKVNWNMYIIYPKNFKLTINNKYIHFIRLNITNITNINSRFDFFLLNNNIFSCGAQNVIILAMYYFILSRYKTIYLFGVDMSEFKYYFIDSDCRIYKEPDHFYKEERLYIDFVKKGDFDVLLGYYVEMFKEFKNISKFAKHNGTAVYNCSINSYIDVFEKKHI